MGNCRYAGGRNWKCIKQKVSNGRITLRPCGERCARERVAVSYPNRKVDSSLIFMRTLLLNNERCMECYTSRTVCGLSASPAPTPITSKLSPYIYSFRFTEWSNIGCQKAKQHSCHFFSTFFSIRSFAILFWVLLLLLLRQFDISLGSRPENLDRKATTRSHNLCHHHLPTFSFFDSRPNRNNEIYIHEYVWQWPR